MQWIIPPEGSTAKEKATAEARLLWGLPGHENEYCLNFSTRIADEDLYEWDPRYAMAERILKITLGEDYAVMTRGTRVEIYPSKEPDHERVGVAVVAMLAEVNEVYEPID